MEKYSTNQSSQESSQLTSPQSKVLNGAVYSWVSVRTAFLSVQPFVAEAMRLYL